VSTTHEPQRQEPRSLAKLRAALKRPGLWVAVVALALSWTVGRHVPPTWTVERITLDVKTDDTDRLFYMFKGERKYIPADELVPREQASLEDVNSAPRDEDGQLLVTEEYAFETVEVDGEPKRLVYQLTARCHWRYWSLLPAAVAVALCWITREPVTALFGGIVAGAFLLGRYNITEAVLVDSLASENAAGVLILYLWMLGGLMGIWSRTGAAQAFADLMTRKVVRGPRTAKLVAWCLGIIFFQGGTVSTVLVGTTVRPLADKQKVSHEELAYIVDSTASPIASRRSSSSPACHGS